MYVAELHTLDNGVLMTLDNAKMPKKIKVGSNISTQSGPYIKRPANSNKILGDFHLSKLNQVFDVWGLGWNTTFILNGSLEWLVLTVDLIDELVEFVNLAFAAVLEPIIGIIQSGGNIDYPTY